MIRAALAALALSCALPAAAAEFNPVAGYPDDIIMTGEIVPGDEYKLSAVLAFRQGKGMPTRTLSLHSPGGRLAPASLMAAMVRQAGITTSVPSDAECSSACMLIFAGGAYRYVWRGGHLGVHSASLDGADNYEDTTHLAREMAAYGTPPVVLGKLVTTPSSDISWLTAADIAGWAEIGEPTQPAEQQVAAAETTSMTCRSTANGHVYSVVRDGNTMWINGKPTSVTSQGEGHDGYVYSGPTKYGVYGVVFDGGNRRIGFKNRKGEEAVDTCW